LIKREEKDDEKQKNTWWPRSCQKEPVYKPILLAKHSE